MTALLAVIGHPISHSLSPRMHGAALAALGVDATYLAIDVAPELLASTLRGLRALDARGLNVTLPHKEAVIPLLDAIDDEARAIGAVNTIVRDGARWIGTNTDARGLARSIAETGLDLRGTEVTILGAGGAARAAAFGVGRNGARKITIVARRVDRADAIARDLAVALGASTLVAVTALDAVVPLRRDLAGTDLLIQATSATLDPLAAEALVRALPLDALRDDATVLDLVYRPRRTALLVAAEARGLRTIDGVGMLVHQGALALELWLGVKPPIDVMRAAVIAAL